MSGLQSNSVDLDSIFEPRQGGDPAIADVGIQNGGADISNRYAPASVGTPAGNVRLYKNGANIGPLFAALGSRFFTATMTRGRYDDAGQIADYTGFSSTGPTHGAMSNVSLSGQTIQRINTIVGPASAGGGGDPSSLNVRITGTLAQNFFTSISCSLGTFSTASASGHLQSGGGTIWSWDTSNSFADSGTELITIV